MYLIGSEAKKYSTSEKQLLVIREDNIYTNEIKAYKFILYDLLLDLPISEYKKQNIRTAITPIPSYMLMIKQIKAMIVLNEIRQNLNAILTLLSQLLFYYIDEYIHAKFEAWIY